MLSIRGQNHAGLTGLQFLPPFEQVRSGPGAAFNATGRMLCYQAMFIQRQKFYST